MCYSVKSVEVYYVVNSVQLEFGTLSEREERVCVCTCVCVCVCVMVCMCVSLKEISEDVFSPHRYSWGLNDL